MCATTITLLLCTFVLANDVAGQYGYGRMGRGIPPPKVWFPVPVPVPADSYHDRTARKLVLDWLGFPNNYFINYIWANVAWWNIAESRYMRYRLKFDVYTNFHPFEHYVCYGNMWWPKFDMPPIYMPWFGFPYNFCYRSN